MRKWLWLIVQWILYMPAAPVIVIAKSIRDFAWTFRYKGDPVLYVHAGSNALVRGRIASRCDQRVYMESLLQDLQWAPHSVSSAFPFVLDSAFALVDENTTWCRGHDGEAADAFRAFVAMDPHSLSTADLLLRAVLYGLP